MNICGLQKTTVVDYPGELACTIFLHGCNFRCGYCYNAELVTSKPDVVISEKEILTFLEKRKPILDAVCITGGEPLLSLSVSFVSRIKQLGYKVKIDTNGTNPQKLKMFIDQGLVDYIAMDIKAPKEDYEIITRKKVDITAIEETIKLIGLFGSGEFRTTVLESFHTPEKMVRMAQWVSSYAQNHSIAYALQGFKNQGNFIQSSYSQQPNTSVEYISSLGKVIEPFFSRMYIRV